MGWMGVYGSGATVGMWRSEDDPWKLVLSTLWIRDSNSTASSFTHWATSLGCYIIIYVYNEHVFYHLPTPLTLFQSSSLICSPHLMSFKILIYFYLCVCSCVSEYMPHVCGCPQRSGRRVLDPLELEWRVDSWDLPNIGCWEPNSGFLEDQKTLLALSSLQHPSF